MPKQQNNENNNTNNTNNKHNTDKHQEHANRREKQLKQHVDERRNIQKHQVPQYGSDNTTAQNIKKVQSKKKVDNAGVQPSVPVYREVQGQGGMPVWLPETMQGPQSLKDRCGQKFQNLVIQTERTRVIDY